MNKLTYKQPETVSISGVDVKINTGHRGCLLTFAALEDKELLDYEKIDSLMWNMYDIDTKNGEEFPPNWEEYVMQAFWFLSCGKDPSKDEPSYYSFEQDSEFIYDAFLVRGIDLGEKELHWWTFCGHFPELPESRFTTITGLRYKKAHGMMSKEDRKVWKIYGSEVMDLKSDAIDEKFIKELLGL